MNKNERTEKTLDRKDLHDQRLEHLHRGYTSLGKCFRGTTWNSCTEDGSSSLSSHWYHPSLHSEMTEWINKCMTNGLDVLKQIHGLLYIVIV